jgi:hypothetical protein
LAFGEGSETRMDVPPSQPAPTPPFHVWKIYAVAGLVALVVSAGTSLLATRVIAPPNQHHPPRPAGDQTPSPEAAAERTVVEEGEAEVTVRFVDRKGEVEVFYKTRFASPPQLTFPDKSSSPGQWSCQVTEQKVASFKLERDCTGVQGYVVTVPIKWRAEGVPAK